MDIMFTNKLLRESFGVSDEVIALCENAETSLQGAFEAADKTAEYNQLKVIHAMQTHRLSDIHFASSTGYGYNDLGRDVLEAIYAEVFGAEDSLVRPQMISGTHALTAALFGCLRPGDEMLSVSGAPYDTLNGVIGITKKSGSLLDFGITYKEVSLDENGGFDYAAIEKSICGRTKMAYIQRSKGYSMRRSITVPEIKALVQFIKQINPDIICMVDNCYGEFVETLEPTDVGADLTAGSLIKNPGGGLAPVGGYICGKKTLVESAAGRLSSPALGKEAGPTLGLNSLFLQGLFLAPQVVGGALKGAMLASFVLDMLGYNVSPKPFDTRADIVQAACLGSAEAVSAFCDGVQAAAAVDSFVKPVGAYMPGYGHDVIMAAGAFVQGSSIELSADAPMIPPYNVYFQGGLSYTHAKLGVMKAIQKLIDIAISIESGLQASPKTH